MTGHYGVMAVTVAGAFVCGMMLALLGGLKLALAKRLELGEGRVGALLSVLNLALLPTVLQEHVPSAQPELRCWATVARVRRTQADTVPR